MSDNETGSNPEHGEATPITLDLVTQATRNGADDAREAAQRAWNATSLFASRFVYTTCYTLSYGVVFPSIFIACAIPKNNVAVRGLMDGAHAAIQKVEEVRGAAIGTEGSPALSPA